MRYHRLLVLLAATALIGAAVACGDDDDVAPPPPEEEEVVVEDDVEVDVEIDAIEIGETVRYGGFRFEVEDMEVDDEVGFIQLTFNVSVENISRDTATPSPSVSLRWDDGRDVVQVRANTDFREVPGESTGSGTIEASLDQDDLEIWDLDTARLVFGSDTEAQAQVPLGDDAELVTRESVPQDVVGTLQVADLGIEIVEAMVVWDGPDVGFQVEDGTALFVLTVDVVSNEEGQLCISASDYQITLPDGTRQTADFAEQRCFAGGEDVRGLAIGFTIDDPFAGDYDIVVETEPPGAAVITSNVLEFELVAGDDVTSPGNQDDDDDEDEDEDEDENENT